MPDLANLSDQDLEQYYGNQGDVVAARNAAHTARQNWEQQRSEAARNRRIEQSFGNMEDLRAARQADPNFNLANWYANYGVNENRGVDNNYIQYGDARGDQPGEFDLRNWYNQFGRQETESGQRQVAGLNGAQVAQRNAVTAINTGQVGNPSTVQIDGNAAGTSQAAAPHIDPTQNRISAHELGQDAATTAQNLTPTQTLTDADIHTGALGQISGTDIITLGTGVAHTVGASMSVPGMETLVGNHGFNAATGFSNVDPRTTVQGQYNTMMDQSQWQNGIPNWARGAARTAQDQMAARGVGSSTMSGEATTAALMQAALPIASADATRYANVDQQNFQARVTALFNDQAATNAAAQFNATSQNQTDQFFSNLRSSLQQFNVAQSNTMEQFNAQQRNVAEQFNVAQQNTADLAHEDQNIRVQMFNQQQLQAQDSFNQQMSNQREQFNAQAGLIVDQSNVQWRRAVNTANTAATNATNQSNAQMMYGLTAQTMNSIWQEMRDEAQNLFTSQQNQSNRDYNLAAAALQRDFQNNMRTAAQRNSMYSQIGNFVAGLLGSVTTPSTPATTSRSTT